MPAFPKILIISESIDVEDSSGTKGRVALIQNLKAIGCEIEVHHYTRKNIQLPGIKTVSIKEHRRSLYFFLSRIERHLRHTFKIDIHKRLENKFGFSFTLYNDRNSIIEGIKKASNFKPDFILTLSKGGSFRPHHALLNMPDLHQKWIAYIHDPYPMHLYPPPFAWVEPGQFKKWEFVRDISEKAAYKAFPSKLLKNWMGSYFPGFLENSMIIPHQISHVTPEEIKLPEFFNASKFIILHAGNLLDPRDPRYLVDAFAELVKKYPEAMDETSLLFIGKASIYQDFLLRKSMEIKQINFIPEGMPFETVREMQRLASINVILEAKSQISPFLPGKFPHCVQANKPILLLGPALSESRRLLGKNYPYWAKVSDTEKIFNLLEHMYLKWKDGATNFKLDRKDLEEYLSIPYLKKEIKDLV